MGEKILVKKNKERGDFACGSWLYGWNLIGTCVFIKKNYKKGTTISSIGDIAKTKEKAECFNDETFYNKLRASDF